MFILKELCPSIKKEKHFFCNDLETQAKDIENNKEIVEMI